ncbi:hypothetical protein ABIC09_001258 [Bradyrhizobium sp. S3.12.5]
MTARENNGVAFMRKDEIVKYFANRPLTLREEETI